MKKLKEIIRFGKVIIADIGNDNVMKYSASLAYCTIFSLAPMLIIVMTVCGFFFGEQAMQGEVYGQIKQLVGPEAAIQIQDMIKNIHLSRNTPLATTVSILTLIIGATGIFGEIQDSLNKIWCLKVKPQKNTIWKIIINRLLSFSLILSLAFILAVSLLLNAIIQGLGNRLGHIFPGTLAGMLPLMDNIITFIITTLL